MFPIFFLFVIFALITFLYMNKSNNSLSKEKEEFLERERAANSVRKMPLTDLDYIDVDLSSLPKIETDDEYILERLNTLNRLASDDVKIANLSSYTNTELKLKYGVANLTLLTEYDQNFTTLCRCLYEISKRLYDLKDIEKAKAYLEYGIKCKTDLKLHYTLLADIYEENLQYKEIVSLISSAKTVNSALKTSLIKDLEERLKGTNYSADDEKTPLEDISLS